MDWIAAVILAYMGIKDFKEKELSVGVLLGIVSLATVVAFCTESWKTLVLGIVPGVLLCILAVILPESIGMGDGIVSISYGLLYGWKRTCIWLMVSFLLLAVFGSISYLKNRKKDMQVAFVPFLLIVHVGLCL